MSPSTIARIVEPLVKEKIVLFERFDQGMKIFALKKLKRKLRLSRLRSTDGSRNSNETGLWPGEFNLLLFVGDSAEFVGQRFTYQRTYSPLA